jgi:NAD(P)-dependent dehydrogenase (short-subunit alcohol dehydrogenase family)
VAATSWGPDDLGDLTGRTVLVTGANSGIGYEAAVELAAHGAHVVLGCRDPRKAELAADRIVGYTPRASVEILEVDLSSQASVTEAAARFTRAHARLDVLVNNAGVMGTPLALTEDGFEQQFATNVLGPFTLTGHLLDLLLTTAGSRVVTVSSHMHRFGHLDFDDLQGVARRRNRWLRYSDTKLANLLFTAGLDQRLRAAGATTLAVAVHPGWAHTALFTPRTAGPRPSVMVRAEGVIANFGQSAAGGALPTLFASAARGVEGGEYLGPSHLVQMVGPPKRVGRSRRARRHLDADRLWVVSESLTGVHYRFVSDSLAA